MKINLTPRDRGRRALVTGASSGIGREIGRVLAANGFDVILVARRLERLEALALELKSAHGVDAVPYCCDLTDPASPDRLFADLTGGGHTIDLLFNNAGSLDPAEYHKVDWEFHRREAQLLALSPAQLIHLFLPGMLERGYGRIVNVTSTAAYMPGVPVHGLYCASKSFLYKLSETLAAEYYGTGVTVTATVPGFTESEILDQSGARPITDKLPAFLTADPRVVATQAIAAGLAGYGTYTHTLFNRLVFLGGVRHLPARHAHKLMRSETKRAKLHLAGDHDSASGIPGIPKLGRPRRVRRGPRPE